MTNAGPFPILHIDEGPSPTVALIHADDVFPQHVWNRVEQICKRSDATCVVQGHRISIAWTSALAAIPIIASLRSDYGFTMEADSGATNRLTRARDERNAIRAIREGRRENEITSEQVVADLAASGFVKRELNQNQLRDLTVLVNLENGANFSVPGAGKTTVTLALHLLTKETGSHILVVCPKNALSSWYSVVGECIDANAPDHNARTFVRLDGDDHEISALLASGASRFVITYDKIITIPDIIKRYLATNIVHLVLDESHRIKGGDSSIRGRELGDMAPFPYRRDILTGTPVPKSVEDLAAQMDFLWPGLGLGNEILAAGDATGIIDGLFARTKKSELNLPPIFTDFEAVPMGDAQRELYLFIRSSIIPYLRESLRTRNVQPIAKAGVMRLLQASSNPEAAVQGLINNEMAFGEVQDELFQRVIQEGASNKILRACELAANLVNGDPPQKVVIWTTFRDNIDMVCEILRARGIQTTFIDGRVDSGSERDPETREGRIAAFHRADGPNVMVANPAACSEGVNLHKAAHHAIYLDRSYNAAHYLQSRDRIHRLGLLPHENTYVTILQSVVDNDLGSVDHSVGRKMKEKLQTMDAILNDDDLRQLALDEELASPDGLEDIELSDIEDLLNILETRGIPTDEDQA